MAQRCKSSNCGGPLCPLSNSYLLHFVVDNDIEDPSTDFHMDLLGLFISSHSKFANLLDIINSAVTVSADQQQGQLNYDQGPAICLICGLTSEGVYDWDLSCNETDPATAKNLFVEYYHPLLSCTFIFEYTPFGLKASKGSRKITSLPDMYSYNVRDADVEMEYGDWEAQFIPHLQQQEEQCVVIPVWKLTPEQIFEQEHWANGELGIGVTRDPNAKQCALCGDFEGKKLRYCFSWLGFNEAGARNVNLFIIVIGIAKLIIIKFTSINALLC
eukprot:TRINITY_DN1983_c0_g1_i1.p1 TRINITY_DN1983_c0_g1~~TRINITY_DN1983_c0_g1_i1.p1  ORF type:complete len:272 (+),score=49.23 TRINITY_DN1983_c0_g1_i1:41-856(+)